MDSPEPHCELKSVDVPENSFIFRDPTAGTNIVLLNGVFTGAGYYNRVGSRIEMKSVEIRGTIFNDLTSTVPGLARIIIFYDRQRRTPNPKFGTGLATISELLKSRDQTGTATTKGDSEINLDYRDRFIILRDYQVYIPPVDNAGGTGVLQNGPDWPGGDYNYDFHLYIDLHGLPTLYEEPYTGTATTISRGSLAAAFVCTGTDGRWSAKCTSRLRFYDK